MLDGFYINLARSSQRRKNMEEQLARLGLDVWIKRFEATDGRLHKRFDDDNLNTVWACRQSHEAAILQSSTSSATLVLEDDAEFSHSFPEWISNLNTYMHSNPQWDILFLDCIPFAPTIPALLAECESLMPQRTTQAQTEENRHVVSRMVVKDAFALYGACTVAYIVSPAGKQTLRKLFDTATALLRPIDLLFRDWIHNHSLKAAVALPFLVTVQGEYESTIAYDAAVSKDLVTLISHALRRLLFAGDSTQAMNRMGTLVRAFDHSREYRLGMQLFDSYPLSFWGAT